MPLRGGIPYVLTRALRCKGFANYCIIMKAEIVVVGSCITDETVYVPRLPLPGETIEGSKYQTGYGGKGGNQCVAAAKLGAKTAMVSKVGNDFNGKSYIENLKQLDVNIDHLTTTDEACTGIALILVSDDGMNSIGMVTGANMLLSTTDVDRAIDIIRSAKVVMCQMEINSDVTTHALKMAKEAGVVTIFNLAPAVECDLERFCKYTEIFCCNETEATALTGLPVIDINSAKVATLKILQYGCQKCVLTLGKQGCVYAEVESKKVVHIPTTKVKAVDTTGAGDSFLGTLAYFICHFESLTFEEKLSRACAVAAITVCGEGTQKSYPRVHNLPNEILRK